MPAFTATAPGKIILFGEHAVVYGEPAIAAPVFNYQARTVVSPEISNQTGKIHLEAQDIGLDADLDNLEVKHPLKIAVFQVLEDKPVDSVPPCRILISSSIPQSAGLGSGAAVTASLIRAFSAYLGKRLSDDQVSQKTFEVEKVHHGNPSGIDNTVVTYKRPLYFQKGKPIKFIKVHTPITILIADSGKPGDTLKAVEEVHQKRLNDPETINEILRTIGSISNKALESLKNGSIKDVGILMNKNHQLLSDLGVSSPELDHLVDIARSAGALGAKLSGGGLGGHMIALIEDQDDQIVEELKAAGATSIISTTLNTD
jgi:mevalonate kinase